MCVCMKLAGRVQTLAAVKGGSQSCVTISSSVSTLGITNTSSEYTPSLPLTLNNYLMILKGVIIRFVQCGVPWCDVFERRLCTSREGGTGRGGWGGWKACGISKWVQLES